MLGWKSAAWIAAGVFMAQVLIGLLDNIPGSLLKVGIGLLLAFALDPLVVRVRNRFGVARPVAVGIVGGGAAILLTLLVVVVGPPAVEQAQQFGRELPQTVEALYDLPIAGPRLEEADASGKVVAFFDDLPARIDSESIGNAAERLLTGVVSMITVLLVAIALLVDGDRLVRRLLAVIPDSVEDQAVRAGRIFTRTIGAYFSGSILVAICAGAFILAAGLALGIPLAPAAGLWAIAVNMIPQIGGLLTGGFFAVLGFSVSPTRGLICAGIYFVYMEFENYVLGPAIVGEAVDLSPPATLIAALIGGATAGVVGAMASTPLCGAIKAIYREVRYGDDKPAQRERPGLLDRLKQLRRKKEPPTAEPSPA